MQKRISVLAHPRSRLPRVEERAGVLHVFVREPAVDGKATEAVQRAVANHLGVSCGSLVLRSGAHSKRKEYVVRGISL